MAQQGAGPGMAANPAAPMGPETGTPWEQNMMARLGPSTNPEDIALRQRMFQVAQQAGTGPQFQGSGRPEWQQVGAQEAVHRVSPGVNMQNPMMYGDQIARLGNTMGGPSAIRPGTNTSPGSKAARATGYAASRPGAMGQLYRTNPAKLETTKWMGRG